MKKNLKNNNGKNKKKTKKKMKRKAKSLVCKWYLIMLALISFLLFVESTHICSNLSIILPPLHPYNSNFEC
jgi:hypothetical protein